MGTEVSEDASVAAAVTAFVIGIVAVATAPDTGRV